MITVEDMSADAEGRRQRQQILREQIQVLRQQFAATDACGRDSTTAIDGHRIRNASQEQSRLLRAFIGVIHGLPKMAPDEPLPNPGSRVPWSS